MEFTHHMIDDEKMETIEAWRVAKQPVRGSMQAIDDTALGNYFQVLDTTGDPQAAQKAFFETFATAKKNN